jgi:hypothetical protein
LFSRFGTDGNEFERPPSGGGSNNNGSGGNEIDSNNPAAIKNRLGVGPVIGMAAGGLAVVLAAVLFRRRPKNQSSDCSTANMIEIGNTSNPIINNTDYSKTGIIPEPVPTSLTHSDLVDIDLTDV